MILSEGMNVKIVLFPEGEDPDSFANKNSQEELKDYLGKKSKDFITFKTDVLSKNINNDPAKRVGMIKDIASSIAQIPDDISRSEYIKICSRTLTVKELEFSKEVSLQKNKKINSSPSIEDAGKKDVDSSSNKRNKEEKEIVRLLLNYGNETLKIEDENISIANFIIDELGADDISFENESIQSLMNEIFHQVDNDGKITLDYFTLHINSTISNLSIDLISNKHNMSKNWEQKHRILTGSEKTKLRKAVENAIYALKLKHLDKKLSSIQQQLKEHPSDFEKITKSYAQHLNIRKLIVEKLGRTIC